MNARQTSLASQALFFGGIEIKRREHKLLLLAGQHSMMSNTAQRPERRKRGRRNTVAQSSIIRKGERTKLFPLRLKGQTRRHQLRNLEAQAEL